MRATGIFDHCYDLLLPPGGRGRTAMNGRPISSHSLIYRKDARVGPGYLCKTMSAELERSRSACSASITYLLTYSLTHQESAIHEQLAHRTEE